MFSATRLVRRSSSSGVGTGALTSEARSSWDWYWFEALAAAAATAAGVPRGNVVIAAVLPARCSGLGPVALLPLTMYIQAPSALRVMSCGS